MVICATCPSASSASSSLPPLLRTRVRALLPLLRLFLTLLALLARSRCGLRQASPGPYSGSRRVCAGRCGLVVTRRCAAHRAAEAVWRVSIFAVSSTRELPRRSQRPATPEAACNGGPIARNRGHSSPAGGASIGPSGLNRRTSAVHNSVRSHRIADSQPTVLRRHHCRPAALSRVSGSS